MRKINQNKKPQQQQQHVCLIQCSLACLVIVAVAASIVVVVVAVVVDVVQVVDRGCRWVLGRSGRLAIHVLDVVEHLAIQVIAVRVVHHRLVECLVHAGAAGARRAALGPRIHSKSTYSRREIKHYIINSCNKKREREREREREEQTLQDKGLRFVVDFQVAAWAPLGSRAPECWPRRPRSGCSTAAWTSYSRP